MSRAEVRPPVRTTEIATVEIVVVRQIVRLGKVKTRAGTFWFDLARVQTEEPGEWLIGDIGAAWGAPHAVSQLPVRVLVLVAGRPPLGGLVGR